MAGLQKLELERLHSGNHEIEICEIESEQDLLSHQQGCLKNPGHAHFIAVNDFTIHHLPDHYHDKDFYQLIKILAFLTVRVAVATVSPHRPQFFHGTDIPYLFHGRGGTQGWVRYGTGRVWDVESYQKTTTRPVHAPCVATR
ncbi:uncharacterized protein LOC131957423 [Physella acuta]|uniref:uncharacterized protein LOC131957423 n=1 Tax=Physella acuta TaxID=109671 RepID=UPI0027DE9B2C|nr:uncharacterized protein LOC131957423 [Physella acuta]XP_059178204.1 uncharacterized protein LOC131957423 [Physella acuta]XP_059178205.1 uncharacterized protein LOC131957423 [Physella acuta]